MSLYGACATISTGASRHRWNVDFYNLLDIISFMKNEVADLKRKIMPIMKKYGVRKAALFGSFVRREMKGNSDIDVLVEIGDDASLLDFIELKQKLEEKLGKKVDLVEYDTLKPLIKENILKEQVVLL